MKSLVASFYLTTQSCGGTRYPTCSSSAEQANKLQSLSLEIALAASLPRAWPRRMLHGGFKPLLVSAVVWFSPLHPYACHIIFSI